MRRVLWPVKTEAASVIAEMRQNAKWAASRPAVRPLHVPNSSIISYLCGLRAVALCRSMCCVFAPSALVPGVQGHGSRADDVQSRSSMGAAIQPAAAAHEAPQHLAYASHSFVHLCSSASIRSLAYLTPAALSSRTYTLLAGSGVPWQGCCAGWPPSSISRDVAAHVFAGSPAVCNAFDAGHATQNKQSFASSCW